MKTRTRRRQLSGRRLRGQLSAALALALGALFAPAGATASTPGAPAEFDFNYAALYTGTTVAGNIDDFILRPEDDKGRVSVRGSYVDDAGSFSVPPDGFDFPEFKIEVMPGLAFDADLELVDRATGNYDQQTGNLDFGPTLALTFGLADSATLPVEGTNGPLECVLTRLDTSLSSEAGWPHAGSAFALPGTSSEGSIAGAWRSRPPVQSNQGGELCEVIAHLVDPVGGLWLANSSLPISALPAATSPKPAQLPYTNPPDPAPTPEDPPAVSPAFKKAAVPLRASPGSVVRVPVRVVNRGETRERLDMSLRSSKPRVRVQRRVSLTVPAGATVSRKIPVKVLRKARGKARITMVSGGRSSSRWISIK